MDGQNFRQQQEDSDGRESSLSADSAADPSVHGHPNPQQPQVRVLGEPLSDRSSSDESAGRRPRTLIDAESRQAVDGYQTEDDSLQFFEEQERQIALQLAQENGGNENETEDYEQMQQEKLLLPEEDEEAHEMMSRIEEEEEEEQVEEDGDEKKEAKMGEKEEEKGDGQEKEEDEQKMEVENEEGPPLSPYSGISESLQNREFPGADLLTHPEEIEGQQQKEPAQPFLEGYPIGYPTDPPPAYSSPRKERTGTATKRHIVGGAGRYPVPAPYEMTLTDGEHKTPVSEENSGAEGTSGTANIRRAIGDSLTMAGGMAAAVLAAQSAAEVSKRSPFASPRGSGHGVDSPRGDAQRQSAAVVVQGARTVAELQQKDKGKAAKEQAKMDTNEEEGQPQQQQQKRKEADADLPHYPISAELKALFGQIEEYVAKRVEIVPCWKPFQIDYIPAVGEVDPFIKVPRPDDKRPLDNWTVDILTMDVRIMDNSKSDELLLGLAVLDEPATQQSDSAVVDLRLHQMAGNSAADAPVKKLSRADKNAHQIDRWVQNMKELRRTKAPTRVVYGRPMPSIESLMQEWPAEVEQKLKEMELLINANLDADLEDFVDLCLGLVDIPVHKSRLESLHVLFSLYAEFRASQHFRNMALGGRGDTGGAASTNIDQFVMPD